MSDDHETLQTMIQLKSMISKNQTCTTSYNSCVKYDPNAAVLLMMQPNTKHTLMNSNSCLQVEIFQAKNLLMKIVLVTCSPL